MVMTTISAMLGIAPVARGGSGFATKSFEAGQWSLSAAPLVQLDPGLPTRSEASMSPLPSGEMDAPACSLRDPWRLRRLLATSTDCVRETDKKKQLAKALGNSIKQLLPKSCSSSPTNDVRSSRRQARSTASPTSSLTHRPARRLVRRLVA